MKLLFKDQVIGTISEISHEGYWNYGVFEKNEDYSNFAAFLDDLISEEGFDEKKYDKDYLDDENWFILLSDEKKEFAFLQSMMMEKSHLDIDNSLFA